MEISSFVQKARVRGRFPEKWKISNLSRDAKLIKITAGVRLSLFFFFFFIFPYRNIVDSGCSGNRLERKFARFVVS